MFNIFTDVPADGFVAKNVDLTGPSHRMRLVASDSVRLRPRRKNADAPVQNLRRLLGQLIPAMAAPMAATKQVISDAQETKLLCGCFRCKFTTAILVVDK